MNPSQQVDRSKKFRAEVVQAAQQAHKEIGCLASVSLAQWALESGYGRYQSGRFNYFGMKWYKGCPYQFRTCRTHEIVNGQEITMDARFQNFPDMATAFVEHAKLLMNPHGRYARALPFKNECQAFIEAIAPIYATDPRYAQKLKDIVAQWSLTDFDV